VARRTRGVAVPGRHGPAGVSDDRHDRQEPRMAATRQELEELVVGYLTLIGEGQLDEASGRLAADVEMVFPGDERHHRLHDQQEAGKARYRRVRKSFDGVDVDLEREVVVVRGTLSGENLQGVRFQNVRFVDRFEIVEGRIRRQLVWNDLAVTGVMVAAADEQVPPSYRVP
jgi:hypothetical protein